MEDDPAEIHLTGLNLGPWLSDACGSAGSTAPTLWIRPYNRAYYGVNLGLILPIASRWRPRVGAGVGLVAAADSGGDTNMTGVVI